MLLTLCLNIPGAETVHEFGRVLYNLAVSYDTKKQYIKSEALFRKAIDFYADKFCYEKFEAMVFYSMILNQNDIKKTEANYYGSKGIEMASQMPYWYPYMVNLMVPQVSFLS